MRFSCDAQALCAALGIVSHSLPVRSPKPILEGILLESEEGGLRLTCSDFALGITTLLEAEIAEEGRALLPGKFFCDLARKLPGGRCEIAVDERMQASIHCQSFHMTLSGLDPVEYPELPEVDGARFAMEQGALREMINGTLFATAVEEDRPILTGLLLEITPESMGVVALDGFRLALRRQSIAGPSAEVATVLGAKALSDVARILQDSESPVEIAVGQSHTAFSIDQTHVIVRALEGEYIRYRQILPAEWKTSTSVARRDLESAIDRASLIAREGKNNLVRFAIEGDEVLVSSNSQTSDSQERIPAQTRGDGLTIAFNVRYITDILKVIGEERVVMRFNSNVSPCVICPEASDAALYLVLPVRVFAS